MHEVWPPQPCRIVTPTPETVVISACLIDWNTAEPYVRGLRPEHFFTEAWRQVFDAILHAYTVGTVEVTAVCQVLLERDRLIQVGGTAAIAEIVDHCPHQEEWASMLQTAVDTVRDDASRRAATSLLTCMTVDMSTFAPPRQR